MANKHRGEVDVTIAGKTYAVAMSLDAVARVATALGVETMGELEERIIGLRAGDLKPILAAILAGNGHEVAEADIGSLHWQVYTRMIQSIWAAKPAQIEEAEAPPRKRAS